MDTKKRYGNDKEKSPCFQNSYGGHLNGIIFKI